MDIASLVQWMFHDDYIMERGNSSRRKSDVGLRDLFYRTVDKNCILPYNWERNRMHGEENDEQSCLWISHKKLCCVKAGWNAEKSISSFFNWWQKIFACADLRCEKLYCNWKRWKLSWKSDWVCLKTQIWGNTAQRLCDRCVVKFFVRWNKKRSEYLMYSRAFLWNMTGNLQADGVQNRQTLFVRYCLEV